MRPPTRLLPSIFLAFRAVYIPAAVLSHTGHGLPYLNTALVLCATFGMEYLTRRSRSTPAPANRPREVWFVVIALLLLGLFPEEAPTSVILWAAVGAVWGRLWPGRESGTQIPQKTEIDADSPRINPNSSAFIRVYQWLTPQWLGLLTGGVLGLTGLFGPGSWLMAGILAWWWFRRSAAD